MKSETPYSEQVCIDLSEISHQEEFWGDVASGWLIQRPTMGPVFSIFLYYHPQHFLAYFSPAVYMSAPGLGTPCRYCHHQGTKKPFLPHVPLQKPGIFFQIHPGDLHIWWARNGSLMPKHMTCKGMGTPVCLRSIRLTKSYVVGRYQSKNWALPAWKRRKLVVG